MTIAVTGATGHLGYLVIQKLKEKVPTSDIIALARSPERAADFGVNTRAFDYSQPETLNTALANIDTLVLISSSEVGQRVTQHRNVIDAATNAGIKKIIYTSLLHADTSPLALAEEHRQTEAIIRTSRIPFTILRNGWYTENYSDSINGALTDGAFIGSAGHGKISSATRQDYAEAAAAVAISDAHNGKVYELAGDTAWTMTDLAAEVSRQTERNLPYKNLSEADYAAALTKSGIPEGIATFLAGVDVAIAQGALFDDSRQLSTLISRPTTSLSDAVAALLKV